MHDGQPAETTACGRYQKRAIVIMVRRIVRMAVEDMVGLFLGLVMGMTMQRSFRIMLSHDFSHRQRAVRCVARDRKHGKTNNQRDRQKRSHDVVEIMRQSDVHRVRFAMASARYSPSRVNKSLTGNGPPEPILIKPCRPREAIKQWRQVKTHRHRVISGTIVMRSALGSMKDAQATGLAAPIAHNS